MSYEAAPLDLFGARGLLCYIKVEETEDKINYIPMSMPLHVLRKKTEKKS